jgi:hypothetical protein
MARDYSKGKIYKIMVSTEEEYLPYVGSTTKQYLSQRMEKHRSSYKRWKKNEKSFTSSFTLFDRFGVENCYIELIELFPCSCSDELLKKEREWFDKLECCNQKKPYVSNEENKKYFQEYNDDNREHRSEVKKKYYEQNKQQISEKVKEYREKNREQISERKKEKYTCECGNIICKSHKARHERSQKHQLFIQQS